MGAAAFIIAEYVNVAYIEVVKAAIIPAVVSYGALFYVTHLEACKLGLRRLAPEEVPSLKKTIKDGWYFFIPLGMLLIELLLFRHSPELAAFRTILVLQAVMFLRTLYDFAFQKKPFIISLKEWGITIGGGLIKGSLTMVTVALATAAAGMVVGIVNMGIGGMITQIVEVLSGGNVFLLLFITAIASLLLGMGLPTTATYIVMASLTAPIIVKVGAPHGYVVPLIAAHLFCFYFGILANDTPPVGLASYTAAAIAGSSPIPTGIQGFLYDLRTAIIPFMFIFNADLLLWNITSVGQAFLIGSMAMIGAFAFTSAVQGWFSIRNKWYESILLLMATLILFNPKIVATPMGITGATRYLVYLFGLILVGIVFFIQKTRETIVASDVDVIPVTNKE